MENKNSHQIYAQTTKVSCKGLAQKSPHPLIYLNLLPAKEAVCPYCGLKYIYKKPQK